MLGGRVFAVGFDVHAEVFVMFWVSEAVMFFQSVNFGLADRRDLTFVGVKRGDGFRYWTVATDFTEGRYDRLRTRQSWAAANVFLRDSDSGGKIAPELRMRAFGIFFFRKIFEDDRAQGAFGARGENAAEMAKGLGEAGHIALYGIYFDTDKAVLKPESRPTLEQIAKLLTSQPQLSVFIVGHTDNQGAYDYNLDLSKRRAEAIAAELV